MGFSWGSPMRTNDPIIIRRVTNGFLVTPARVLKGCSPEIRDTLVFLTAGALAEWLDEHFEELL